MGALTFDTLSLTGVGGGRAGRKAGHHRNVWVIKEAQDAHLEEPATKADLRAELAEAKGEIIKWVAVMLAAQAGLIATLVKLL